MSRLVADLVVERRPERGQPFRLEASLAAEGGITVVCGASGAGKSTLLLALLGAVRPLSGRIALGDLTLFDSGRGIDAPTRVRRIGMAFQDAPLFPHLDARRNAAFGIRGADRDSRARALLERVGASDLSDRMPDELSGGQRQRVALARALGAEPAALLLDEPFSAIDATARGSLGDLLVELQAAAGIPFVHVTHDLSEALRLGSNLVLLDGGSVVQTGPPADVIARPASIAAARAVGTENLMSGVVLRHLDGRGCTEVDISGSVVQMMRIDVAPGSRVTLGLRAEEILLALRPIRETSARNVLEGVIETLEEHGAGVEIHVNTPAPFRVMVTPVSVCELGLEAGKTVHLLIKATAFHRLA